MSHLVRELVIELLPKDIVEVWNTAREKQRENNRLLDERMKERELKQMGFRKVEIK